MWVMFVDCESRQEVSVSLSEQVIETKWAASSISSGTQTPSRLRAAGSSATQTHLRNRLGMRSYSGFCVINICSEKGGER